MRITVELLTTTTSPRWHLYSLSWLWQSAAHCQPASMNLLRPLRQCTRLLPGLCLQSVTLFSLRPDHLQWVAAFNPVSTSSRRSFDSSKDPPQKSCHPMSTKVSRDILLLTLCRLVMFSLLQVRACMTARLKAVLHSDAAAPQACYANRVLVVGRWVGPACQLGWQLGQQCMRTRMFLKRHADSCSGSYGWTRMGTAVSLSASGARAHSQIHRS
mmetsp:Transcript_69396/g.115315  ORF Transcript_69396/g.115315 Transcript_69396/m.115315 type:complete len:214 (-) Transcript_69396:396-1037(-)